MMEDFLKYNYHTHTPRCNHAWGTEREYIEMAIGAGIKRLGFSDHAPYPQDPGFQSTIRMPMDMIADYRDCLRALQREYADRIEIRVGFEAEYIPEKFQEQMDIYDSMGFDYLILGQHFFATEQGPYTGTPTADDGRMREYAELVISAIETGRFLYIAHPDIINYQGLDSVYEWEVTRICRAAKEHGVPLELNALGYANGKQYPSDRFFSIAAQVGNDVIIGMDAHEPRQLVDRDAYEGCVAMAQRLGLHLIDGGGLLQ